MNVLPKSAFYGHFVIVTFLFFGGMSGQLFAQQTLFKPVNPEQSHVSFENALRENDSIGIHRYEYFYNGGGVAVADLNGDNYPDLVFTGNLLPNRLYINGKGMKFEDISEAAGFTVNSGWSTGVTVADVNGDGLQDIYICRAGLDDVPDFRRNLLYIHQGNNVLGMPVFEEKGAEFGLDDPAFSTQAAFFDYDRDGDLDMFLMNHRNLDKVAQRRKGISETKELEGEDREMARHKLYRNEGGKYFTELSREAGIDVVTLGLGLAISDLDQDGWPDIYVGSDGFDPDLLLHNQGDGSFKNELESATGHTSFFSMGVDIADVNNDGLPDIAEMDMLGKDQLRAKTMMPRMEVARVEAMAKNGMHYQSMRNMLQLNRGDLHFSETGQQAGIFKTDWSWSCLLADYDLDGLTDLFVTNGIRRDFEHLDFAPPIFARLDSLQAIGPVSDAKMEAIVSEIPSVPLQNHLFRNRDGWHFEDISATAGLAGPGFSNGAAYGDLDQDGDLDLVINNIDAPATILENLSQQAGDSARSLHIQLYDQASANHLGIGSRIDIWHHGTHQMREIQPTRGFQSAVAPIAHFGIPNGKEIAEIRVTWPDGCIETKFGLALPAAGELLLVQKGEWQTAVPLAQGQPAWQEMNVDSLGLNFRHLENEFDDYTGSTLLPHRISRFGPALATGDVNGDGRTDVLVGGAAGQAGQIFLQTDAGRFELSPQAEIAQHRMLEDLAAQLLDVDGDADLDLIIASGGPEFAAGEAFLRNRLYRNDGDGHFKHDPEALPASDFNSSCIAAADVDGDGDLDLFIGGRSLPGRYPYPDQSQLLRNEGGRFVDQTADLAPELQAPGLVHSAVWLDQNGDQRPDLLIAGEWMPLRLFLNVADGNSFRLVEADAGLAGTEGWWWHLATADLDQDGDLDVIAGNLGTNHKFNISAAQPLELFGHDFDADMQMDVVLAQYQDSVMIPVRGRQCSADQIPSLWRQLPSFTEFGSANLAEIYGEAPLRDALHLSARDMRSMVFLNGGDAGFSGLALPAELQMGAIFGVAVGDWDQDGKLELVTAGNLFEAEVETGRFDAGIGSWVTSADVLAGKDLPIGRSGLALSGNVRHVVPIQIGEQACLLVVNNDGPLQVFRFQK